MIRRISLLTVMLAWTLVSVWAQPAKAAGASLYFSPASKSLAVGSTVTLSLKVNTGGQAINAAEATIVFSTNRLQLSSLSTSGSIFSFWAVQPSGSNSTGRITLSGGLPSPGYTGSGGKIISATFRATAVGQADLSISGAKVLANDGQGTDILTSVGTASITVTAASTPTPAPSNPSPTLPSVSSTTHPSENAWYQQSQASMTWSQPSGVTSFRYALTQDANATPDQFTETTLTAASVSLPADGVWYFVLQSHTSDGWGGLKRFRLQYDHTAPDHFTLSVIRDRGPSDPTPQVQFETTDATSGVDHYTVSLDGVPATTVSSPATLTDLKSGQHTVVVTAVDKAGNSTASEVTVGQEGYQAPTITSLTSPLLLLDRLEVKGTANAGDTVTVYVNGQAVGQSVAGQVDPSALASGVTVRAPWTLATDQVFRPGHYNVTAVAMGPDGQVSVASDPVPLVVSGHSVLLGGRPIATVAFLPVATLALIFFAGLITWTMIRLLVAVQRMHQRDLRAEEEIDTLRRQVRRKQLSDLEVEESLENIERDLERPTRRSRPRRPSRRRSS